MASMRLFLPKQHSREGKELARRVGFLMATIGTQVPTEVISEAIRANIADTAPGLQQGAVASCLQELCAAGGSA
jgi:hypothetical protein